MTSRHLPLATLSTPAARWAVALAACAGATAHAQTAPAPEPAAGDTVQVPAIVVNGRISAAEPRSARIGLLGDTDAMDAPFSVTGYSATAIADRQASTVAEVIANDPSVRISVPSGGLLDAFYIRGFAMNEGNVGEVSFDGVYGVASNYRLLTDYIERVELIKGPTALINGMAPNGGVGGSINIVPKRATGKDVTQVGVELGSDAQLGARVDLGRRFGDDKAFGMRLNVSGRNGDTALDKQARDAFVGALALDYQGRRLRATLDLVAQREALDAPSRPIFLGSAAAVPQTPAAPTGRRNVTQAWEWSQVDDQSLLGRADYDFHEQLTAFAGIGGGRTEVDRVFGNPLVGNSAGDASWTPARFRFDIHRKTAEVGLRARPRTGAVEHAITIQASRYADSLHRGSSNGTAVSSNLYSPVDSAAQDIAAPALVSRISETTLTGLALSDTMSMLDERVLLSLGVRTQRVATTNFNASTGAVVPPPYDERATTPLVGVVVKPWQGLSLYANHIQGLSKGDVTQDGVALAPYKARQYELGAKWERDALTTTLALFQITKPSGQLSGGIYTALEQRNRGIELALHGATSPSLRLQGGVTLLDAELTRTGNAATEGKRPIGVPKLQANLGAEWDTPWSGFTLTGSVAHAGRQYVDTANLRSIPAWTRVDVGARWRTLLADRLTTWRLNVQNLLDRDHWAGVSSFGGIAQGTPRTLQLSAAVDF